MRLEKEAAQFQTFRCQICLDTFTEELDVIPLELCEHLFHTECMSHYLETQIASGSIPSRCPHTDCAHEVGDSDVREILTEELYQKYSAMALSRAIEQTKDISWCPTPDCKYAFVYKQANETTPGCETDDASDKDQLKCPICAVHYCLACRVVYHEGQSCEEYQSVAKLDENDVQFLDYVRGSKFKQCPHCNFWVERTLGCDHMKCRCGKDFCYKCGGVHNNCECTRIRREE